MIDTSPGRIRVGRKVYPDPRNYGEITVTRVIQKSSQVGVTKMALDLGHEPIWEVFNRFGIGQPPGPGFPGRVPGAAQSAALARHGKGVPGLWLRHYRHTLAAGQRLHGICQWRRAAAGVPAGAGGRAAPGEAVISADCRAGAEVLHAVTGEHGTARKARVPGYQVGGKTGTVHKVGPGVYR